MLAVLSSSVEITASLSTTPSMNGYVYSRIGYVPNTNTNFLQSSYTPFHRCCQRSDMTSSVLTPTASSTTSPLSYTLIPIPEMSRDCVLVHQGFHTWTFNLHLVHFLQSVCYANIRVLKITKHTLRSPFTLIVDPRYGEPWWFRAK